MSALARAEAEAEDAMAILASVEALPRRIGAQVRWRNNGAVWTRAGDDDWRPDTAPGTRYPTEHVASAPWEVHSA